MADDLLQPHYADAFRCTGSDCDDNCCGGWTVFVDKATHQKYGATPSLRQLASEHEERVTQSRDTFKYARIRLTNSHHEKKGTGRKSPVPGVPVSTLSPLGEIR